MPFEDFQIDSLLYPEKKCSDDVSVDVILLFVFSLFMHAVL